PRPYAGLGLGEVMVFLFFGLMATCGTAFVMTESVPAAAWWCGAVLGFLAVGILLANNLRDIPTDAAAGKRTLPVRLGERRTRTLYRSCVVAGFATIVFGLAAFIVDERIGLTQWGLLGLAGWIPAIRPMEAVGVATGRDLVLVLSGTAGVHASTGLLLALGLILARTA
ncbi:MAG: UbiA family prenyltransferase, partial [Actinomycetota bacterium]|nr:UbiA family prenyltransferase [Actinomycetota bacterium]